MNFLCSLIVLLLCLFPSVLPALSLSPEAEISVLTCSPGTELYSLFGHSALRVRDSAEKIDIVFNYGTFDFRTEHFYLKYARGLLPYQLSVTSYSNFLQNYIADERSVWSQTLDLDSLQRQYLFDLLVKNYEPANRTYLYNFLFDNCSTRIRDIIEKSVGPTLAWHLPREHKSFWNLLDEYLGRIPWIKWGIHTILAQSGTREATPCQYMFLPDYLMKGLASATSSDRPLVRRTETLYQAAPPLSEHPWYLSPFFLLTTVSLLLIFLLIRLRNRILSNAISSLIFAISGLIGCLLIFLGFFTEHPITAPNFNLIWANPLNLLIAFLLFRKKLPGAVRIYLTAFSIVLSLGIPLWFFLTPAVPLASLPLLLLLLFLCIQLKRRKS